ncbi:MAG: hypothetical protein J6J74_01825 [Elusimicrobiaceae bacterium]|nr:hypothetical protein [Elusimicrobiaceae bacterium]
MKILGKFIIGFIALSVSCVLIACNGDRKERMFSGKDIYGNKLELYMEYKADGECYGNFVRTINGFSSDDRTHFGRSENIETCRNMNRDIANRLSQLL